MNHAFIMTCRMSFLGVIQAQAQARPLFDTVFGIDPTQAKQDLRAMVSSVNGEDANRRWSYAVSSQMDRLDIVQQAILDPLVDTAALRRLQPVSEVINAFVDRLLAQFAELPWVAPRIAVGCVARWSMADIAAANAALLRQFPGLPVRASDQDIVFRRNQPAVLALGGNEMRCNRIATWQTARSIVVAVGTQARTVSHQHVVLAETDCSSDQDRTDALGVEAGVPLLRALAAETIQLLPNEIAP